MRDSVDEISQGQQTRTRPSSTRRTGRKCEVGDYLRCAKVQDKYWHSRKSLVSNNTVLAAQVYIQSNYTNPEGLDCELEYKWVNEGRILLHQLKKKPENWNQISSLGFQVACLLKFRTPSTAMQLLRSQARQEQPARRQAQRPSWGHQQHRP